MGFLPSLDEGLQSLSVSALHRQTGESLHKICYAPHFSWTTHRPEHASPVALSGGFTVLTADRSVFRAAPAHHSFVSCPSRLLAVGRSECVVRCTTSESVGVGENWSKAAVEESLRWQELGGFRARNINTLMLQSNRYKSLWCFAPRWIVSASAMMAPLSIRNTLRRRPASVSLVWPPPVTTIR